MYSTQNLIVNGGFSRTPPDPRQGWDFTDPACRGIALADPGRDGLPHSAYAVGLEATDGRTAARLSQTVPLPAVPARRFVLRVTACGRGGTSDAALIVAVADPRAPGGTREVCRRALALTARWQRYRVEFDVAETSPPATVSVVLQGPSQPGATAAITDVRLVGLLRPAEKIAIRFDTRSDMSRASSRLRAFLLEDYLHLLGCRTSLNGGLSFDVCVCQKVRPWLRLAMAKTAGAAVIFDLDDNELLVSAVRAFNVRWFARLADGMTVGSEFLGDMARVWAPRQFRLDNPVDVLDREVVRGDAAWNDRLVWFGMPENRWMLDRLGLAGRVTTITRDGDVAYGIRTIDRDLVSFDLALLPVALNDETQAKNANRLVKCVALGLPFLASDTPEHRHALAALRLPDDFLVPSEDAWRDRIAAIARRYPDHRRCIEAARPRAFDVYGVERIAAGWIEFCAGLVAGKAARSR